MNEHHGNYIIAAGQWPLLKLTEKKYIDEKIKKMILAKINLLTHILCPLPEMYMLHVDIVIH